MIGNNWLALLVTLVTSLIWLRINDFMAHKGIISSHLSRKIIHIGTGPIFVLCWLLFENTPSARFIAAIVPFAITFQFFLIGSGYIKDQASVEGMSRSGDPKEILKGPLYYGIVFVIITIIFWTQSAIGIIALMLLCGGDGFAEIIGNRVSSKPLPWSKKKSWAGTAAMFLGGFLFSVLVIGLFIYFGIFTNPLSYYLPRILIIAIIGTLVESLPVKDLDNITVPVSAILMGYLLF